jgi:acyl-CoA synthetase (AMP-forming)/AMP-acid ligase II
VNPVNQSAPEISRCAAAATLAQILHLRAAATPQELCFRFLISGEEEGPRLTYAELDRQARAIAVALAERADPGDRAVLLYEPGLEFLPAFFGCLYAGLIAVPAYPPRLDRLAQSWQSLGGILHDCQPRLALTSNELAPGLARGLVNQAGTRAPLCLATDEVEPSHADDWQQPRLEPEAVAYLQYTSGSTAAPKGVMITHRNLMCSERAIQAALIHRRAACGVLWLPLYHDLGLVAGALLGVFHGGAVTIMSPLAMLQRPLRWLQALTRFGGGISGGPNFAFDLCVERISPQEKKPLDLSTWTVAGIGAEPISARTMNRFAEAFACCGFRPEAFYPCYGLAEATLLVTGVDRAAPPTVRRFRADSLEQGEAIDAAAGDVEARTVVGCGRPWLQSRVEIVDPVTRRRRAEGQVGEIWFAGPAVARGYWNRLEETTQSFDAHLEDADGAPAPFLRTGDLGFLRDGELFITGRLKDLIVIRGRNYYPEDVEQTVQQAHAGLCGRPGAAFETGGDGLARLVVVQELDRRCPAAAAADIAGDIRQAVAERHHLQVHDIRFLEPGSLPRTSSGKVQRHACRAGYERGTLRWWRGS